MLPNLRALGTTTTNLDEALKTLNTRKTSDSIFDLELLIEDNVQKIEDLQKKLNELQESGEFNKKAYQKKTEAFTQLQEYKKKQEQKMEMIEVIRKTEAFTVAKKQERKMELIEVTLRRLIKAVLVIGNELPGSSRTDFNHWVTLEDNVLQPPFLVDP